MQALASRTSFYRSSSLPQPTADRNGNLNLLPLRLRPKFKILRASFRLFHLVCPRPCVPRVESFVPNLSTANRRHFPRLVNRTYGLLNQSVVLTFRADAFLYRIDELQRCHKRRSWELEDFLVELDGSDMLTLPASGPIWADLLTEAGHGV